MNYLKNTSPKFWHVKNIDHIDVDCPPWFEIKDRNKCTIATIESEYYSDAALMAAAPELLAALREYVERHEAECDPAGLPEYELACAAIAKATSDQTVNS